MLPGPKTELNPIQLLVAPPSIYHSIGTVAQSGRAAGVRPDKVAGDHISGGNGGDTGDPGDRRDETPVVKFPEITLRSSASLAPSCPVVPTRTFDESSRVRPA